MKCAGCPAELTDLSKERYRIKGNYCDDCIKKVSHYDWKSTMILKHYTPPISKKLLDKYPHLYNE